MELLFVEGLFVVLLEHGVYVVDKTQEFHRLQVCVGQMWRWMDSLQVEGLAWRWLNVVMEDGTLFVFLLEHGVYAVDKTQEFHRLHVCVGQMWRWLNVVMEDGTLFAVLLVVRHETVNSLVFSCLFVAHFIYIFKHFC
jgi:hypothetical protein